MSKNQENARRWVIIGRGNEIADLRRVGRDRELPINTPIEVHMRPRWGVPARIFDLPGIEHLFAVPEGMVLHDVFEEGGIGIATMEVVGPVRPTQVAGMGAAGAIVVSALIAFLKAHWIKILIGGFILGLILSSIIVWAFIAVPALEAVAPWLWVGAIGAVAVGAYLLVRKEPGGE